jgi:hypothetical protein
VSGESGDAKLLHNAVVGGVATQIETNVFVKVVDIYGQEFYSSYQSGISVTCAFEVNSYDFEVTKHIEADTNKPLYATSILYGGAEFNIVRHQSIKNTENTLLICS